MARVPLRGMNQKIVASIPTGRIRMIAALALVLRPGPGLSAAEIRDGSREQCAAQLRRLLLQLSVADAFRHRQPFLDQDWTAIEMLIQQMNRHASHLLAQAEGPEKRLRPTIVGQKRWVDVYSAQTGDSKQRGRNKARETGDADQVRLQTGKKLNYGGIVQMRNLPERNITIPGQLLNAGMHG